MKKTLSLLLSLVLMLSLALPASAAETEYPTLEGGVTEIQKYGNIVLDIDPADLKDGGYTYGDLLTVTVNGTGYDMPLCTNYSDVDTGALVLRDSEGVLIAAINMGTLRPATAWPPRSPQRTAPTPGSSPRASPWRASPSPSP